MAFYICPSPSNKSATAHASASAADNPNRIALYIALSNPFIPPPKFKGGPIYKISYDLSQDYRMFIVRSTYDSDLQRAKSSLANIVSQFTNTVSDDITILQLAVA